MRKYTFILLAFLLTDSGFAQSSDYSYKGRTTTSIKKENLLFLRSINDIPEVWANMGMPYKEQMILDKVLAYRKRPHYTHEDYDLLFEVVSVEIRGTCNGKHTSAMGDNSTLTTQQKSILNTADLGSDVSMRVRFKHKNKSVESYGTKDDIVDGWVTITVVPQVEAEYPGGYEQLSHYYQKNIVDKVTGEEESRRLQFAIVQFVVNEDGTVTNVEMSRSSEDAKIDKLIIDATSKMPAWKPARNLQGTKVKQIFLIPFGTGGC